MYDELLKNLKVPTRAVDVVMDTDTYNEIDDQFAVAYLLRSTEKLNTKALYAAPFTTGSVKSPKDGMQLSYDEIIKLQKLMKTNIPVFKGSECYLPDENTAVISDAAKDLANRAMNYTADNPLYVVAIGAITNVASALLINPEAAKRIVVIWLGGHARHFGHTKEYNMKQDYAAARAVMGSEAPFVQLPCFGVVSDFNISEPELRHWLLGKTPIADYVAKYTIDYAQKCTDKKAWSRVIWDVTAVAWLLNDNNKFMLSRTVNTVLPQYNGAYSNEELPKPMEYVYYINRDALMDDLIAKLLKE